MDDEALARLIYAAWKARYADDVVTFDELPDPEKKFILFCASYLEPYRRGVIRKIKKYFTDQDNCKNCWFVRTLKSLK